MADKSKMFDSTSPGDGSGEQASPRRTIVGGRPPEGDEKILGLPEGIQKLLMAALHDAADPIISLPGFTGYHYRNCCCHRRLQ